MRGLSKTTIELIVFARLLLAELHPMTFDNSITPSSTPRRSSTTTHRQAAEPSDDRGAPVLSHPGACRPGGTCWVRQASSPPEWIVDETRETRVVIVWANTGAYLQAVKRSYRRESWQTQPRYCEIWCEKATVLGSLPPLTDEMGVTVLFGSVKADEGYIVVGEGRQNAAGRLANGPWPKSKNPRSSKKLRGNRKGRKNRRRRSRRSARSSLRSCGV